MHGSSEKVLETAVCPYCSGSRFSALYEPMHDLDNYGSLPPKFQAMKFNHVSCDDCSTAYLRERVTQDHIGPFYSGEYHCFKPFDERGAVISAGAKYFAKRKAAAIASMMPANAQVLLDYGCGSGTWLRELREIGVPWKMVGTDVVPTAVEMSREIGVEAYVADENSISDHFAPNSVGVIHMFHVIEHLPRPVETLESLKRILAPGGYIVGQTPNIDSWDAKLFGRYWTQWHVPRHLVLYTPNTLKMHAEKAGLAEISIQGSPLSVANWAGSLLKWSALSRGKEFHPTAGRLYPLLMLAAAPVVLLQMAISTPSNIDFVFRKPC